MSVREVPALRPPPADAERLRDFPRFELGPERPLMRVVRAGRGPWYFGSSMAGRFDLPSPHGTCYLAEDAVAALLEMIGGESAMVPSELFAARRLRTLSVPRTFTLADATSRRAFAWGVTAELGTVVPYALPQTWARRLHAARADGIVYWLRHDPARSRGFALFGETGERRGWRRGREQPITGELLERLTAETGVELVPIPRSEQLIFADD